MGPASPDAAPAAPQPQPPPPTRREIFGWCCFDFANSSFTTVVVTVVFAVYFTSVIVGDATRANSLWGIALGVSQGLVVILGPFFGALADRTGRKKQFLLATAITCVAATLGLALAGAGDVGLAMALFIVANFAFSTGENFTASFLPELSTPANCGRISGYGWAFGYFGGLFSLALALALLKGLDASVPAVLVATGLFFAAASLPTFLLLRERAPRHPWPPLGRLFRETSRATFAGLRDLRANRPLLVFFLSYFCFMTGLTAVIAFAAIYATSVFGFTQSEVILLFIGLQLSAAAGAFGVGALQDRLGSRSALLISLAGWVATVVLAAVSTEKIHFALCGVLAGAVMGSAQASARAVVALLGPPDRPAETFGQWGFFGKLAAIVGPILFGAVSDAGSMRTALLVTGISFAAATILLLGVRLPRPSATARRPDTPTP